MPTTTEVEATININAIGQRTDFAGSAVADLSAEEIRFDQAQYSEGVLKPVEAFEVNEGAGGTMNVVVGSGNAKTDYVLVDGDITGQGSYVVRLDEVSKTITLGAADASSDRVDEIWLVVLDDAYDASTKALPILAVREGDLGAGAPGPDGSWEAAIKLATVNIPSGISDITGATITDERVYTDLAFSNGGTMPVGGGFLWFASAAPTGHILARGQLLDPADYPRLFQLWGTQYGGDGSSTFGVPDLRQRLPMGRASSGVGNGLGDTGGSIDHDHSQPSHTHSNPNVNSSGSHVHSQSNTGSAGSHAHSQGSTGNAGGHNHGGTTGNSNEDSSFFTGLETQITLASRTHDHNISSVGSHSHSTPNTNSNGSHTHSNPNVNSNGSHAHSQGSTGSAGGETTGSANPPFFVVEYAIRAA